MLCVNSKIIQDKFSASVPAFPDQGKLTIIPSVSVDRYAVRGVQTNCQRRVPGVGNGKAFASTHHKIFCHIDAVYQSIVVGRLLNAELSFHNRKVGFLCEGQRKHRPAAVVDPGVKFYQFILQIREVIDEQNCRFIVIEVVVVHLGYVDGIMSHLHICQNHFKLLQGLPAFHALTAV